ncbi:ataxin-7 isoform X1 [Astyanax mexicanus]|uniref:ataxin-7 isoform X1 n=1 Tax=Astyanax mexicanus TaxID=7994 RepID=UPI0020CAFA8F|nr:ataxin-7 isoform X1 [Astyanax mexicanus]
MSDRADEEVRGERSRAGRQQQLQRGEAATAMAPACLPSPQITPGQSWSSWADGVKLHGGDGPESEESFKECGKNREAMRLCRDDMPIFGQCPAQDDFYLVMCSHCSQVVKPQAFQAHYERRHGSISKSTSAYSSSTTYPLSSLSSRSRSGGVGGSLTASGGSVGASSSGSNSTPSAKEKMPHRKPHFPSKVPPDDLLTPAVKVEKIHLKMEYSTSSLSSSSKLAHVPTSSSSSSSASTVSSSPAKPGLNSPSVPKAQLLPPGHIPNGKGHLSSLDKKPDSSTNASSRRLYRRQSEREFNPDIHCGVLDIGARKPCTRSLTCKTHSLSQRRAVPGRRKRFDTLLAEHKNRAREKELQHRSEPSQQTPPLRDPQPPLSRLPQDPHHLPPHGNGTAADAPKPFTPSKPKPHNPGLPRSSSHGGVSGLGDPAVTHDSTQHLHSAPAIDGVSRLSSDEGENEEREEGVDNLDCHYSGYHPRPAAYCTFGSRLFGRSCYSFDRRWDRVRCALAAMMDKHVNSLMWKKIPLAPENSSSSAVASSHRSSTNSLSSSSGFLSPSPPPPYGQSYDSKPMLSYGTTLNARAAPQRAGEQLVYGGSGGGNSSSSSGSSRQVSSSSPQMPSAHSSSLPSTPSSSRPPKSRSGAKSFRVRDSSSSATLTSPVANSNNSGSSNSGGSSSVSASSSAGAKKRKNSALLTPHSTYAAESSSSFKKNCAVNSGTSGSSFHSLTSTPSSTASSSSLSSSSHSTGANFPPGRANSLSLRQEAASRGPPPASPAEPIKRMSVVMNSSDSTLSLGPFVHQSSEHHSHTDTRIDSKRRKSSPASSSLPNTGSAGGGGGSQAPNRSKVPKSPAINNIHSKHARPMPGTPGLPNNSLIHQPKARP